MHWLSQREHSEAELRRKLLRAEREAVRRAALGDGAGADGPDDEGDGDGDGQALPERIDAVIDWLRTHDFLSDARFVESRVHARAPGHGLRRIRQELEQHGVALPVDTAAALRGSEFERADAMRRRRYGDDGPATLPEQTRCARWLVQRGFSGDTVARVVRSMRRPSLPAGAYGESLDEVSEG